MSPGAGRWQVAGDCPDLPHPFPPEGAGAPSLRLPICRAGWTRRLHVEAGAGGRAGASPAGRVLSDPAGGVAGTTGGEETNMARLSHRPRHKQSGAGWEGGGRRGHGDQGSRAPRLTRGGGSDFQPQPTPVSQAGSTVSQGEAEGPGQGGRDTASTVPGTYDGQDGCLYFAGEEAEGLPETGADPLPLGNGAGPVTLGAGQEGPGVGGGGQCGTSRSEEAAAGSGAAGTAEGGALPPLRAVPCRGEALSTPAGLLGHRKKG